MKTRQLQLKVIITFLFLTSINLAGFSQKTVAQSTNTKVAYFAAYMKGTDEKHLYYAIAKDKYLFNEVNSGNPILAASLDDKLIRDPMILKDNNGIYHLVATVSWTHRPFVMWDSKDLVHWENERLIDVAPVGASKTWAPEIAYNKDNGEYIVYWTGEINNDWSTASIYYSSTKDFITFSAPQILFKEAVGILDADIHEVNGVYKLIYRMNGIWVASSNHITGPYSNQYQLTSENVEGPYAFDLKDSIGYGIVWDYYAASAGFGLWTSPDFTNWTTITNASKPFYNANVSFPASIRHGSIMAITEDEFNTITSAFGGYKNVTFRVDMTGMDVTNGVYICGTLNQWVFTPMVREGASNIYSVTLTLLTNSQHVYYFKNAANWDAETRETVPVECAKSNTTTYAWPDDRAIFVPANDTVIGVKYSSCELIDLNTGISKNSIETGIQLSPNPVKDILSIKFPENMGDVCINIYRETGQKVFTEQQENDLSNLKINIADLNSGIYLLEVRNKEKSFVNKITVQK